jgi:hypothetical protein
MVTLEIADVAEEVRDVLAAQARERGQSLQEFLLGLLVEEATRAGNSNIAVLRAFENRTDGVGCCRADEAPGPTS